MTIDDRRHDRAVCRQPYPRAGDLPRGGELESLLSDPEWNEPYLQLLQEVPEVMLAHAQLRHELQRLPGDWREPALMS